jgi:hypothetical protein
MTAEKTPQDLHRTLAELIEESKALASVATVAEKARIKLQWLVIALLVVVIPLVVIDVWIAVENKRTGDAIIDCTTPEGDCFQRNQTRTGEVIQRILDGQIANTECRDEADVRACVEAKLAP